MKKWQRFWMYGSTTVVWLMSQLGVGSAANYQSTNYSNHNPIKSGSLEKSPIYLQPNNAIGNGSTVHSILDSIFSNNVQEYAHYSHRSHSSHRSHYSHTSGTGSSSGSSSAPRNNSRAYTQVVYDVMPIIDIQNKLNELGYDCGIADGIKGANTIEAIKNFQNDYGLQSDGLVGSNTKISLNSVNLKNVQHALIKAGFFCQENGVRDQQTIDLIYNFQSTKSLESNGKINAVTKSALGI